MKNKNNKLKLKLLKDEPILEGNDSYFDFYHKKFVPALVNIIESGDNIQTIGLFGRWGTGKSTVIKQLSRDSDYLVFTFDVWKYQEDALRRTFLIDLKNFLIVNKIKIEKKTLESIDGIYTSYSTQKEVKKVEQFKLSNLPSQIKSWAKEHAFAIIFLVIAIITGVIWLSLNLYLGKQNEWLIKIKTVHGILAYSTFLFFVMTVVAEEIIKEFAKRLLDLFSPVAAKQMIVETKNALNSPEQFEVVFKELLESIPKDTKLVVIFDNIDRVEGDKAVKVLSAIKTFLEPSKLSNTVFIIPCDADAVKRQITIEHGAESGEEFLRKLFGVILWTPEFINSDLEEYTRKLIDQAGEDSSILQTEDVVQVITQAFGNNPRQIKQFINNLISQLLVAEQTKVGEYIKDNVAYLAKVLVLRQIYPDAYKNLKEKWFDPENIEIPSHEAESLKPFLLTTVMITTTNAKPFIYFKIPYYSSAIEKSEELESALVQGNKELAREIIGGYGVDDVADFVTGLYQEYKLLNNELSLILSTYLSIISTSEEKPNKQKFYIKTLSLVENQLFSQYLQLPVEIVFSQLIMSEKLADKKYAKSLISKFVSILLTDDLAKQENLQKAKEIITNLVALPKSLIVKASRQQVRVAIEKYYTANPEILSIFNDDEKVSEYISDPTIVESIKALSIENSEKLLPVVSNFKSRMEVVGDLGNIYAEYMTQLVLNLAPIPEYPANKANILAEIANSLYIFKIMISTALTESLNKLSVELYKVVSHVPVDNKKDGLLALLELYKHVGEPHQNQIKEQLTSFIQNTTPPNLESFLSIVKERNCGDLLVEATTPHYQGTFRTKPDVRNIIFNSLSEGHKAEFLIELATYGENWGMEFFKELRELPSKPEVLLAILSRVSSLTVDESKDAYLFVAKNTKSTDDQKLKDSFCNNILLRVKTDDNNSGELGYTMFNVAEFLGDARSEIAEKILEWLREPNRLNSNHRFALKLIIGAVKELTVSPTSKRDLVHTILRGLRPETNRDTVDVLIEALGDLKPAYKNNEESFNNLLEALKSWSDGEIKDIVMKGLLEIKSPDQRKIAKEFWKSVELLNSKVAND